MRQYRDGSKCAWDSSNPLPYGRGSVGPGPHREGLPGRCELLRSCRSQHSAHCVGPGRADLHHQPAAGVKGLLGGRNEASRFQGRLRRRRGRVQVCAALALEGGRSYAQGGDRRSDASVRRLPPRARFRARCWPCGRGALRLGPKAGPGAGRNSIRCSVRARNIEGGVGVADRRNSWRYPVFSPSAHRRAGSGCAAMVVPAARRASSLCARGLSAWRELVSARSRARGISMAGSGLGVTCSF